MNTTETKNNVNIYDVLRKTPKFKFKKLSDDIDKAIQAFLTGNTGKFGKYVSTKNALVYRTILTEEHSTSMRVAQDICAIRLDKPTETMFLGNSSVLPLIGRTVSFGRAHNNRQVSEVQTRLSQYIQMIPFSVFFDTGLNLTKLNIIDRGNEETVSRNETKYNSKLKENETISVDVHFTGASLFEVDGHVFLFDIDRNEIKHKIFNSFLVELTLNGNYPETISDAYNLLKPQAVKDAESKRLKVLRQGEWFFIPVDGDYNAITPTTKRWDKKQFEPLTLKAGNNRPNTAQKYALKDNLKLVSGLVEHSGREHHPLNLKGWYLPVPNTSTQSFTLTGDID